MKGSIKLCSSFVYFYHSVTRVKVSLVIYSYFVNVFNYSFKQISFESLVTLKVTSIDPNWSHNQRLIVALNHDCSYKAPK